MRYYPLYIDLSKWHCLVVGAGAVGRRKISTLLKAHALSITVLDSYLQAEDFYALYQQEHGLMPQVNFIQRNFREEDLTNIRLVFSCTSQSFVNERIATLCAEKNILCNLSEGVSRGDCIVPAHVESDKILLALSSSGASPALVKVLKEDLQDWIGTEYSPFLKFMEEIRSICMSEEAIKEGITEEQRRNIFRTLVQKPLRSKLMHCIHKQEKQEFLLLVNRVLPKSLALKLELDIFFE